MRGKPLFHLDEDGKPPAHADPVKLLNYVMATRPEEYSLVNFAASVRRLRIIKPAFPRKSPKIGLVLIETPEYVIHNLQGPEDEKDVYVLLHFKRSAVDAFDEQAERRIIIPGEM